MDSKEKSLHRVEADGSTTIGSDNQGGAPPPATSMNLEALLATLSTVASLWKQEKQHEHVLEIARQAGALYDKFYGLFNDMKLVGKRLKSTQGAYDETLKKLSTGQGTLISRVEKL